jgi:hypothetical protein
MRLAKGITAAVLLMGAMLPIGSMAQAEELKARGVNPAENDTRIDLIFKHNWLNNRASIFTSTLKFDYRISPEVGFNVEMPVLGHFRSASPAPGIRGLNDTGVGDVFARLRYITPIGVTALGATSIGGAVEAVFPTASERTLGSGVYQLNATALLVQAWSATAITAFVVKAAQSVEERHGRPRMQENTARIVQAFILPRGMFVTLDGRYNWETINRRDVWWEGQVEFGMMLDARTAASVALSRKWGDREDRGAVALTFKRFF